MDDETNEPTAAHELFAPEPEPEPASEPTAAVTAADEPTAAVAPVAAAAPVAPPAEDEADEDDDDKKGMSFGTKALIVAAAWILLTLFLIGQMNKNDDKGSPVAVDQSGEVAAGDESATDQATLEEEGIPLDEAGPNAEDTNGNGRIDKNEPGFDEAAALIGASTGGGSGSTSGGSTSGGSTGSGDPSTGDAQPGALPTSGSTTTTAKAGGSGSTTTTTTGSPGTTSTPTTTGGGGGGTTTTTTGGGTPPATTYAAEVIVDFATSSSSEFSRATVALARNQAIRFVNADAFDHTLRINGGTEFKIDANSSTIRTFAASGTFTIDDKKSNYNGSVIVTVT